MLNITRTNITDNCKLFLLRHFCYYVIIKPYLFDRSLWSAVPVWYL